MFRIKCSNGSAWHMPALCALAAILFASSAPAGSTKPMPVRMVVVANFENGADSGDKPGEYQFWVEREHLDTMIKVRGAIRIGQAASPRCCPWG